MCLALRKKKKMGVVLIRLMRSGAGLAREGSRFWIVRPRVGLGQVTGLTTVLSGPEINVIPGKPGEPAKYEFTGLDNPPSSVEGRSEEHTSELQSRFGI